jgi:hypothetical protein
MSLLASRALALVLALVPTAAEAQAEPGIGMITAIDAGTRMLTLETPRGPRRIVVAPDAVISGDGRVLRWAELAAGDAVAYRDEGGRVTRLAVACQFWAVPPGR